MASTGIGTKDKARPVGRGASGDKIREIVGNSPSKDRTETTGKGSKGPSRQELRQEVVRELVKLRSLLKDVGTNCLDRLDGELAGLALSLAGESLPGDPPSCRIPRSSWPCSRTSGPSRKDRRMGERKI
jgi:hypothetical protein